MLSVRHLFHLPFKNSPFGPTLRLLRRKGRARGGIKIRYSILALLFILLKIKYQPTKFSNIYGHSSSGNASRKWTPFLSMPCQDKHKTVSDVCITYLSKVSYFGLLLGLMWKEGGGKSGAMKCSPYVFYISIISLLVLFFCTVVQIQTYYIYILQSILHLNLSSN